MPQSLGQSTKHEHVAVHPSSKRKQVCAEGWCFLFVEQ